MIKFGKPIQTVTPGLFHFIALPRQSCCSRGNSVNPVKSWT